MEKEIINESNVRLVETLDSSSVIKSLEYNHGLQRLTVKFTNKVVWQYENVPADAFGMLISAESLGTAFNASIKNVYVGAKLNIISEPTVVTEPNVTGSS